MKTNHDLLQELLAAEIKVHSHPWPNTEGLPVDGPGPVLKDSELYKDICRRNELWVEIWHLMEIAKPGIRHG